MISRTIFMVYDWEAGQPWYRRLARTVARLAYRIWNWMAA